MTVVLDASVMIAHLDRGDAHHDAADELLRAAVGSPFASSVVTVAEVLVGPARVGTLGRAQAAPAALRLTTIGLPADASVRPAGLRVETGLRLPDCCVLLAARDTEATAVLTVDDRLRRAAHDAGFPTG